MSEKIYDVPAEWAKRAFIDQAKYRAQQHGESAIQMMATHRLDCPIEVALRGDDELDLIARLEQIEVGPKVVVALSAIGTFQIHDDVHALIHY